MPISSSLMSKLRPHLGYSDKDTDEKIHNSLLHRKELHLAELYLNSQEFCALSKACPKLEKLYLEANLLDNNAWHTFISQQKHIKSLTLNMLNGTRIFPSCFKKIKSSLPHLYSLTIKNSHLSRKHIEAISQIKQLRELHLNANTIEVKNGYWRKTVKKKAMTDATLQSLTQLKQLEQLDLSDCPSVGKGILPIILKMKQLQSLNLSHCSVKAEKVASHLQEPYFFSCPLPKLKSLYLPFVEAEKLKKSKAIHQLAHSERLELLQIGNCVIPTAKNTLQVQNFLSSLQNQCSHHNLQYISSSMLKEALHKEQTAPTLPREVFKENFFLGIEHFIKKLELLEKGPEKFSCRYFCIDFGDRTFSFEQATKLPKHTPSSWSYFYYSMYSQKPNLKINDGFIIYKNVLIPLETIAQEMKLPKDVSLLYDPKYQNSLASILTLPRRLQK